MMEFLNLNVKDKRGILLAGIGARDLEIKAEDFARVMEMCDRIIGNFWSNLIREYFGI